MEITELHEPGRDEMREFWQVQADARTLDAPLLPMTPFEEMLRDVGDTRTVRQQRWIARSDGRVIAAAWSRLPMLENTDAANLRLVVHPDARRGGVGRELLEVVTKRFREEGRRTVFAEIAEPLDRTPTPGTSFAAMVGGSRALEEICRILDLHDVDWTVVDRLEADAAAHAAGYDVVQWMGPAAEDVVDDLAVLAARMSTDVPMGDLGWEPEEWDRQRVRETEEQHARMGRQWVTTAARHVATGRIVGYSDIGVSPAQEGPAFQWMTIVDPQHRGKRLGMLLKAANLRLLQREIPVSDRVITWNAESNTYMIAINEALGFRPQFRYCEWKLALD